MLIPRPFFVSFIIGFLTKLGVVVRKKIVVYLFCKMVIISNLSFPAAAKHITCKSHPWLLLRGNSEKVIINMTLHKNSKHY